MGERTRGRTYGAPTAATIGQLNDYLAAQNLPPARLDERQSPRGQNGEGGGNNQQGESRAGGPDGERASPDPQGSARGLGQERAGSESQGTWGVEPWNRQAWSDAVRPFDPLDVEVHPRGLIYLPHERLRDRLNAAFGAGWYRFLPVGDPVQGANEVIWRYRLEFRDGTAAEAVGHAAFIKGNAGYSYGDALETCSSDAFTRCCKACGIGLQVWNRDFQINFMQRYAIEVQSTKTGRSQWRRKDRPPIPYERQSRDQSEPDYVPRETLDQENMKHFHAMNPSPAAQRFDRQLETISREEATWEPSDEEQLRRLHEIEEAAFQDDAREDR